MALTEKDLERIGEYIQSRLPEWLDRISLESSKAWLYRTDPELFERVIRLDCEYERAERRRQEEIERRRTRLEQIDKSRQQGES